MDDVQRLAIEICQNRTDLSDEKKERIQKLLMESTSLADNTPRPSTSSQRYPGIDKADLERLLMTRRVSEFENLRMSRRFSKNRKIFGSDMCQSLGDMKREHKWPSPSQVLAAFRNKQEKPKLSRRLSDIVASKMFKDRLVNGHMNSLKRVNPENDTSQNEESQTFIIPEENQHDLDTHNSNTSTPNSNMGLPKSITSIDPSVFTPFKYKKSYTLRDVYRDLTLMRRAVSACLTNESTQISQPVSDNNSIEIKIEPPKEESIMSQEVGIHENIPSLNNDQNNHLSCHSTTANSDMKPDAKLPCDPELTLKSDGQLQMSQQKPMDQLQISNTNIMYLESKPGDNLISETDKQFKNIEHNQTKISRRKNKSSTPEEESDLDVRDERTMGEIDSIQLDHHETGNKMERNAEEKNIIKSEDEFNSKQKQIRDDDEISSHREAACGEDLKDIVILKDMKTIIAIPSSRQSITNENGMHSDVRTDIFELNVQQNNIAKPKSARSFQENVDTTPEDTIQGKPESKNSDIFPDKTKIKCQTELENRIWIKTETNTPMSDLMNRDDLNPEVDGNTKKSDTTKLEAPPHETDNKIERNAEQQNIIKSEDELNSKQAKIREDGGISSHRKDACGEDQKDIVRLKDMKTTIAIPGSRKKTTNCQHDKYFASKNKKDKKYDKIYPSHYTTSKHSKKGVYAKCPVPSTKAVYDNIYDNDEIVTEMNLDFKDNVDSKTNKDVIGSETNFHPGGKIEHKKKSNQNVISSDDEDKKREACTDILLTEKTNYLENETGNIPTIVSEEEAYYAEMYVKNDNYEESSSDVQSLSDQTTSDGEHEAVNQSKPNTKKQFMTQNGRNKDCRPVDKNNDRFKLKCQEVKGGNNSNSLPGRRSLLSKRDNVKFKHKKQINDKNPKSQKSQKGGVRVSHYKSIRIDQSVTVRNLYKKKEFSNLKKQDLNKDDRVLAQDGRKCRCFHRHDGNAHSLDEKQPTKNNHLHQTLKDTFLNHISCDFSITRGQTKSSRKLESSQQIDVKNNKLCTRNGEITEKTNKACRKNDYYNSFSSCFTTLIRPSTQILTTPKYNTNVSMEITDTSLYRNNDDSIEKYTCQKTNMNNESDGVKFVATSEENENVRKESVFETTNDEQKDTHGISDEENDSVLDDNGGDEHVFNIENEGDDRQRRRKSVMMSRNSCKSRTEFTLSSALSNQTPYSDFEYPDKEIAFDVISTILDDVIDFVWQANVAKFKHHVCKTNDLLGDETVGCILLIDEEKQSPLSYSCKILNPSSFPTTVNQYEILIGNIVEIDISNDYDVREGFVKIAIPFNKSNMRFFHEPILRTYDPRSRSWISIDSFENIYFDENDSNYIFFHQDLSVLETNIREKTVYVIIARPTTEHIIYNDMYVEHDSRIDSDVTVSSPIGSRVLTDTVDITFKVLPIGADVIAATRDSSDEDTLSLVGSSPIIIVEQRNKHPQPLYVSLPCERPRGNALKSRLSSAPSPEDSGYYTQSRLSKMNDFVETWTETESHLIRIGGCETVKPELMTFREVSEDNKVSFCIHEHKTTCFVLETRKEASRPNIPFIALQLLKVFEFQRVVVSVMQNKDVIQDLTVTCDLRSRYATRWRRRLERDYDITSKIANLKEGDIVSINLRGNLTSIGKKFHVFRFHGSQSIKINWNLQVVDKYSQRTLDFYYGFVQLLNLKSKSCRFEEVDKVEGHDWDILLEIPVRLPKHELGTIPPPIKTKLQVIEEGPVTLAFLSAIAASLADHSILVAQSLQISHARLQSLRRQNRNSDTQLVRDLLFTWFKNMPHAKEKATMLIDVLRKCGKHEMAETLQRDNDKYNNERLKITTEYSFEKTLNTVIKSAYLISKWKDLASELGFSLDNINDIHNSANTEKDRCLNMLSKWTNKGKGNWLRNLARCTRRIGCKYVADHLLSTLTKQNQLR